MAFPLPVPFPRRRGATRPRRLRPPIPAPATLVHRTVTAWRSARTTLLSLGGFAAADYAMFQLHHTAGWFAVAGTLLAWEALGGNDQEAAR